MGFNSAQNAQPPFNHRVGGRYQIVQQLGRGGFGQTFLAQDLHLPDHPLCVVKQLQPQVSQPQELQTARRLFDTEAKTLYRLGSHPQIPVLLAHFEENEEFYLVQEFIDGNSLEEELDQSSPWSDQQVIRLLDDMLTPLAFVHEHQVIHRDLKPSNLIRRQRDQRLVLIDFGAVKQVGTQLTPSASGISHTISIGTQGYMPNEQVAGRPKFSSDIYAVGMIAIQALSGQPPTAIEPHPQTGELEWRHLAPNRHPALLALLERMVQYDFRTRYATATDALAALGKTAAAVAESASAADQPTHRRVPPTTAVPTVAVGRRQPPPTRAAQTAPAPRRSQPPRSSSSGLPWLPIGVGILLFLGLGLLIGRALFSGANVPTADRAADPVPSEPETALGEPEAPGPASVPPSAESDTPISEPESLPQSEPPASSEQTSPSAADAPLTPAMAQEQVSAFYTQVSGQSWEAARSQLGGALAQQFDVGFFQQFQRVTVENLQVTRQTPETVELTGQNTYVYADGSTQREQRTYTVSLVDGQPRIVDSAFVAVTQPRGN